ncbi:hypothetical protein TYRP_015164 [Tyrophagus putrescentiae]|nr:hypothetical protein TYRP_015164 [Tyrophagus putrescentiae]
MKYHVNAGLPSKPIYGLDSYNVTKTPVTERDLGPEQIDLGDPKVREHETKVMKNEMMPLVNAAAGQNYSLQSLEEMWNLTPYSAGGNQLNASVKASPNHLPTQNVNIKIVYSEIFPGPPWGLVYKLESYNVTKNEN